MKNPFRLIFSEKSLKEEIERLDQEIEYKKQKIEYLEQEIKKLHLTDELSKATKEIELIKGILAKELKKDMDQQKRLSEFFSISLYMYSKQLSKLTRALLILTTVLVILAIIQLIIVLT
jgi:predicted ribosome quality control (RQC) complex YloA/Tae2 family protein